MESSATTSNEIQTTDFIVRRITTPAQDKTFETITLINKSKPDDYLAVSRSESETDPLQVQTIVRVGSQIKKGEYLLFEYDTNEQSQKFDVNVIKGVSKDEVTEFVSDPTKKLEEFLSQSEQSKHFRRPNFVLHPDDDRTTYNVVWHAILSQFGLRAVDVNEIDTAIRKMGGNPIHFRDIINKLFMLQIKSE